MTTTQKDPQYLGGAWDDWKSVLPSQLGPNYYDHVRAARSGESTMGVVTAGRLARVLLVMIPFIVAGIYLSLGYHTVAVDFHHWILWAHHYTAQQNHQIAQYSGK
jgi:hypothetical protein